MLPIGEQSLLEIQIRNLAHHGFQEVYISTYYKADYVENFIGDGTRFDTSVTFSKEDTPLGTCGPLSLLEDRLQEPFLLINGDILTTIDFARLYRFGLEHEAELTIATKQLRTPFNYGSVQTEGDWIVHMEEKPDLVIEVVAGIYFMRPSILRHVPKQTYFGINHLIEGMLARKAPIARYLMTEYWLDIGQIEDYNEAESAYVKHFRDPGASGSDD